jgi:hypothetical protein
MKVSQVVALSATLALQAQACVRVRVDTLIENGYNFIQEVKLYDNDNPVVTHGKVNFRTYDDENLIRLGGYNVKLQYKDRSDGRTIPYGGRITYPNGRKCIPLSIPVRIRRSLVLFFSFCLLADREFLLSP